MSHTYASQSPSAPSMQDGTLKSSDALPGSAGATVNGSVIDLGPLTGISGRSEFVEALLTVPALTTTMLPDTKTCTYSILCSASTNKGTPTMLAGSCIVQTGAGGAGAAAATFRMKLPTNCLRYLFAQAVLGANTTDSSSLKMTLQLMF